jgi:hypothetical protein
MDFPHVVRTWFEHSQKRDGTIEHVAVIETDLQTDALQDDYDTSELDDLLTRATEWFGQNQRTIDVVRVVPKGWRN